MAIRSSKGESPPHPSHPQPSPISRAREGSPVLTVDQACEADWQYFCDHPDEQQYVRQFVPGEFGKMELPPIPPGFRYATLVSVTLRVDGQPVGRFRELMAVCEDINELENESVTDNEQGGRAMTTTDDVLWSLIEAGNKTCVEVLIEEMSDLMLEWHRQGKSFDEMLRCLVESYPREREAIILVEHSIELSPKASM